MRHPTDIPLVSTIKERCRVCYTCVRECPAKAIRIADGQAEVLGERCIGCGNCVRVCSQHAKRVLSSTERVAEMLKSGQKVAACLAPSFPAEFTDCAAGTLVAAVRKLGFAMVNEVAFGADLVADRYKKLLAQKENKRYIATTCPALVGYVERYYPDIVDSLAPIVSPMIAAARAIRRVYGDDVKVVFIGPCIAKKGECASSEVAGEVDAAITFIELREMLKDANIDLAAAETDEFDAPRGGLGSLFAISRGLLQAAGLKDDLLAGEVVVTDGRRNFMEAIREFEQGHIETRLLEVLCCEGCIMGAGMSGDAPLFSRRNRISQYVHNASSGIDQTAWQKQIDAMADLDLTRSFSSNDQRIAVPYHDKLSDILADMGKFKAEDELNCGACGYDTCREHAVAIFKGLAENTMCLPYTI